MFLTILTNRTNYENDIKEARNEWLGKVLSYLGVDTEELLGAPRDSAVEFLIMNNIEIKLKI